MMKDVGKLLFSRKMGLFFGELRDNTAHRHYAVQLTIANNSKFMCVTGQKEQHHKTLVTKSDQSHQIDSLGHPILILLLDPISPPGWFLQNIQRYEPSKRMGVARIFSALEQFNAKDSVSECLEMVLQALNIKNEPVIIRDNRVQRVIERISRSPGEAVSLEDLARSVNLSMSRLQHLFKEITGVPISKYVMWERMKKGIAVSGIANSLTKSAHGAGFADSSHLSREFKKMFGYTPSSALKDSRNVQVYFDRAE